jgi:hypothetical protein
MKRLTIIATLLLLFSSVQTELNAQFDPSRGCILDANGDCVPNVILSAVPFLRIIPDARSGAMGDVGMAISQDPNAMHFNASKLAFVEDNISISATYTPWLRQLGLQDVYLAYLSGYKNIDELQTFGFGLRFFSLGKINYTDFDGNPQGQGSPREMELSAAYSRKLSEKFSAGLTVKYIYSNLAADQQVGGIDITAANAFAADLSFYYTTPIKMSSYNGKFSFGAAITNLGSKISYTKSVNKDFIPTNLGLGAALELEFDQYNTMTFAFDINKLLIPTPVARIIIEDGVEVINPDWDEDGNGIADHREKSMFSGVFGSFGDAQGGFSEEMKELAYSLGIEYWYDKQFAVRAGYYYEHPLKGDRQFLTLGVGLKYNVFGLNVSYLVPTNNRRNPLDNTLRFSLLFDFEALTSAEE